MSPIDSRLCLPSFAQPRLHVLIIFFFFFFFFFFQRDEMSPPSSTFEGQLCACLQFSPVCCTSHRACLYEGRCSSPCHAPFTAAATRIRAIGVMRSPAQRRRSAEKCWQFLARGRPPVARVGARAPVRGGGRAWKPATCHGVGCGESACAYSIKLEGALQRSAGICASAARMRVRCEAGRQARLCDRHISLLPAMSQEFRR